MSKTLVIERCIDCKNIRYGTDVDECCLTGNTVNKYDSDIPDDCPLEDKVYKAEDMSIKDKLIYLGRIRNGS